MNLLKKFVIAVGVLASFLFPVVAYAQVITFPNHGGTGTSTIPSLGQVLVGQTNGTYGPQATSSLGLASISSLANYVLTTAFGGLFYSFFHATTTDALTQGSTNKYFSNTLARQAISETITGIDYDNSTGIFSNTSGFSIPLTASTTDWNTAYLNRITSANSPLSILANVLSLGTVTVGNGGTGVATFGQGWLSSAGGTTAITSSTSPTVNYITATSTSQASRFPYASTTMVTATTASTTNLIVSGISGTQCMHSIAGVVSGTGSDCGAGGGGTGPATSTNPLMATYMVATSTTATSTFMIASTTDFSIGRALYDSTRSKGTNGQVLKSTGTATSWGSVTATPCGSNTQIQYNNASSCGASSGLTFTNSTGVFAVGSDDIGIPGNFTETINYGAGANGDYFAQGGSFGASVVAYKLINGLPYFASAGADPISNDDNGSTDNMYIDFSWDAVSGADGYRVFFQDTYYLGSNYDYYYDTTLTTVSLGKAGSPPTGGVENSTTAGTTQTPILGKSIIDGAGNIGAGTITPLSKVDVKGGIAIGTYAGVTAAPTNGLAVSGDTIIGTGADVGAQLQVYGGVNFYSSGFPQFNIVNTGDGLAGLSLSRTDGGGQWMFYRYGSQPTNSDRFCIGQNGVSEPFCFTAGGSGGMIVGASYTGSYAAPANGAIFQGAVGVKTTAPLSALDVSGGVAIGSYASTNAAPTNGLIVSGSEGIGTTTPGTSLSIGNTGANTINISATATSTFGSGLNIRTGCYAIAGACITGATVNNTVGNSKWATSTNTQAIYPSGGANIGVVIGGTATTTNAQFQVIGISAASSFIASSTTATSTFAGNVVIGAAGSTLSAANNSLAVGSVASGGSITASGNGSAIIGRANTNGTMSATASGDFIAGTQSGAGAMTASGQGSIILGYSSSGGTSNMTSSGNGAISLGHASGNTIQSSGDGSLAGGLTTNGSITSTANGSFAWGNNVNATANFATAFGTTFTNSTASSFMVGYTATPTLTVTGATTTLAGDADLRTTSVLQHLYPSFSYATTTAWTGSTTIQLGPAFVKETWNSVNCYTDVGTLNVQFVNSASNMNMFNASTTIGTVTLSTNNAIAAKSKRSVQIGTPASSPTVISCTIDKTTNI